MSESGQQAQGGGRRYRIRWWHLPAALAVLVPLCLLAVGFTIHRRSVASYHEYLAEVRAVEPERWDRDAAIDALGTFPPTAAARLDAVLSMHEASDDTPAVDRERHWYPVIYGDGALPADLVAGFDAYLPVAEAARVLLYDEDMRFGCEASALRDPSDLRAGGMYVVTMRIPDLNMWRSLARTAHFQIMRGEAPGPWLADLSLLQERYRPLSLIDSLVVLSITSMREQAAFDAVTLGTLDGAAYEGWLHEVPDYRTPMATGMASERLMMSLALSDAIVDGSLSQHELESIGASRGSPDWDDLLEWADTRTRNWLFAAEDLAHGLQQSRAAEACLRGEDGATWPPRYQPASRVGGAIFAAYEMCAANVLRGMIKHRCIRLGADLWRRARAGEALPNDQAGFEATAPLATDVSGVPLQYERVDAHRFRIVPDATHGGAAWAPGALDRIMISIGSPAADQPQRWGRVGIEIQLPYPGMPTYVPPEPIEPGF